MKEIHFFSQWHRKTLREGMYGSCNFFTFIQYFNLLLYYFLIEWGIKTTLSNFLLSRHLTLSVRMCLYVVVCKYDKFFSSQNVSFPYLSVSCRYQFYRSLLKSPFFIDDDRNLCNFILLKCINEKRKFFNEIFRKIFNLVIFI